MPTLKQVKSFSLAVISGRDKKLQAERDVICEGCDKFFEKAVPSMNGFKLEGHCAACGCGTSTLANVHGGKNAWRKQHCPEYKWPGDIKGKGLSLQDFNVLFKARETIERNIALLQRALETRKVPKGQTKAICDAHFPVAPDELFHGDTVREIVVKLKFYHKVVQLYIDHGRPLDPGLQEAIFQQSAHKARQQQGCDACGNKGCSKCAGKSDTPPAVPQAVPAEKFNAAFADNSPQNAQGAQHRKIVDNRTDGRYGSGGGIQQKQLVKTEPRAATPTPTPTTAQQPRRSVWEPAGPPAVQNAGPPAVQNSDAGAQVKVDDAATAVATEANPENKESDDGG